MYLSETSCDLSVCIALLSSLLDKPVGDKTVAIGEVGLGGEIRNVNSLEQRLREAQRIGFTKAIVPQHCLRQLNLQEFQDMELIGLNYVRDAVRALEG